MHELQALRDRLVDIDRDYLARAKEHFHAQADKARVGKEHAIATGGLVPIVLMGAVAAHAAVPVVAGAVAVGMVAIGNMAMKAIQQSLAERRRDDISDRTVAYSRPERVQALVEQFRRHEAGGVLQRIGDGIKALVTKPVNVASTLFTPGASVALAGKPSTPGFHVKGREAGLGDVDEAPTPSRPR